MRRRRVPLRLNLDVGAFGCRRPDSAAERCAHGRFQDVEATSVSATTSAMMETAISQGDLPPIAKPIGAWTRAILSAATPEA